MNRARFLTFAAAAIASTLLFSACTAQTNQVSPALPYPVQPISSGSSIPYPARTVPAIKALPPRAGDNTSSAVHLIVYRTQEQMSGADRALAAQSQPAIRAAAAFAGFEIGRKNWSFKQLHCQAFPGHLFLLFEDNRDAGSVSLFSVSIPRAGKGHMRLIPVERRGFTLFSPAPVNELAIRAFNRIRAEEGPATSADWLATSLCYAALTDPRFETSLSPRQAPDSNPALSFPPSLEVGQRGESTVRFVDLAAPSQPMQWTMAFDTKGNLVKVEHFPAPVYATRIIPKN